MPAYKRILIKVSGESLQGDKPFGIEQTALFSLAEQIKSLHELQIQMGIVIGGGNLFRGSEIQGLGLDRTPADQVGMLATIMNGIILQQALEKMNVPAKVFSAIECGKVVAPYSWREVMKSLEQNIISIFVGGTSNPYFTTDTAASLRAAEIHADALFKVTKVDGVYDKDPKKYQDAVKYQKITYSEVLAQDLGFMDLSAIALCKANRIPICVFNFSMKDSLKRAALRESVGTLVTGE